MVLQLSSMKTLRMWSSSMPHVGPLTGANKRTLFWRCKRIASEREYIDILTRAGPKTLPNKVPKNSFGGPSWAKNTETGPKNEKVCNLQKLLLFERARIESGIMRGTLSGRRPRDNQRNVLWKKRVFFGKNVFFFKYVCFLDTRRQLRSVPEEAELAVPRVPFAFLQNFLKKWPGAGPRRDFRLATGNTLTWRVLRD